MVEHGFIGPPECDLDVYPWSFRNPYNETVRRKKKTPVFVLTAILVTIAGGFTRNTDNGGLLWNQLLTVFIFTFSADANGGCLLGQMLFIG